MTVIIETSQELYCNFISVGTSLPPYNPFGTYQNTVCWWWWWLFAWLVFGVVLCQCKSFLPASYNVLVVACFPTPPLMVNTFRIWSVWFVCISLHITLDTVTCTSSSQYITVESQQTCQKWNLRYYPTSKLTNSLPLFHRCWQKDRNPWDRDKGLCELQHSKKHRLHVYISHFCLPSCNESESRLWNPEFVCPKLLRREENIVYIILIRKQVHSLTHRETLFLLPQAVYLTDILETMV